MIHPPKLEDLTPKDLPFAFYIRKPIIHRTNLWLNLTDQRWRHINHLNQLDMTRQLLNTELKILLFCNSPGKAFPDETTKNGIYFIEPKSGSVK